MASILVSLGTAKAHLNVDADNHDHDGDIQQKVEDASAIVLDYLKGRANNVGTIVSSSVASPTVITMDEAHTFVNGDTVVISEHEDGTPDLNGSHVVSNVTTLTFTVPIAVTVAGAGGLATVAWNVSTVPRPVRSAILLVLTHLYENRGDDMDVDEALWQAIGRLLMRHRDPAIA